MHQAMAETNQFQQLPYWGSLRESDQSTLTRLSTEIEHAPTLLHKGRLISELQNTLPRGEFVSYMRTVHPNISRKSYFRYVRGWKIARANYPKILLDVLLERNVELGEIMLDNKFGMFTRAVDALGGVPLPHTTKSMVAFVEKVLDKRNSMLSESRWKNGLQPPPSMLAEQMFVHARVQLNKMPAEARETELKRVVSWLASEFKLKLGSVRAVAPPPELQKAPGPKPRTYVD